MKHFDYMEWVFYKEGVLSREKQLEMEEHLYTCDQCMDIFLSLIDEKEVERAEESLSIDFTNKVMKSIENIKYIQRPKLKKGNGSFKDIFIYYAAVASVAIVLTVGGFYSGLVDMVPKVAQSTNIKESSKFPNRIADISGKIVNRTTDFINNFERINIKEDLR
ncbi:MAG: hypothetical protein GXY88_06340 [Tissierellia bacterium]|nr:hypothetical protein [Tissierellia bacterium]